MYMGISQDNSDKIIVYILCWVPRDAFHEAPISLGLLGLSQFLIEPAVPQGPGQDSVVKCLGVRISGSRV